MKKIALTLTLIISLICCQMTTFARTYTIGNSGFAQESDIVILQQRLNWDKPNVVVLGLPENGGPMLDDEHTLLMTIYIASEWGYDVTEKNGTITVSHEKREITIPLNENKATVDGKTIDLFHTQQNDTIYIPYKSLTDLFDVDVSWDADDLCLLITEKETTPISDYELYRRKHIFNTDNSQDRGIRYSDCGNSSVIILTQLNILSGDGNGKFRPDDLLTRAEFSTMAALARNANIADMSNAPLFKDVDTNNWAFNYIAFCSQSNIIEGFEDSTFKPNDNITFAQAIKICLSLIGYNEMITENNDVWYKPWFDVAYEHKLIDSTENDADRKISRVEAAELIYKTIHMPLYLVKGFDVSSGDAAPSFVLANGKEGSTLDTLFRRMTAE